MAVQFKDTIQRGLLADRPAATPSGTEGHLYYATDTFQWFRSNGATWDEQDSVPAGAAGGGLTGTYPNPTLAGVVTGATKGDASHTLTLTYNAAGQVTAASTNAIVIAESAVTGLTSDLAAKEATANKGVSGGYASLDGGGKVPVGQLPAAVIGANQYQGTWNSSTNSPALVSSTGTTGYWYKVSVAGTTTLDGVSEWNVGDMVIFDGTVWDKIDNTEEDATATVKGSIKLAGDLAGTAASPALASIVTGATIGDATHTVTLTFDAKGRVTAGAAVAIAITSSAVTDFTEAAQDAIGPMFTGGSHTGISFSYNDAGNVINATVTGGAAPGAHASTHAAAGTDPVTISEGQVTGLIADLSTLASAITAKLTSPLTTKGDIHGFSSVDARLGVGSNGQVLTADSTQTLGIKWAPAAGITANQAIGTVTGILDGQGSVIPTNASEFIDVEYSGTITGIKVLLDQAGSVAIEVRKCTYAQYDAGATHPAAGDKISASAPAVVSSATKSVDTTLTGWTTAVTAGDIIQLIVSSASVATKARVILTIAKS